MTRLNALELAGFAVIVAAFIAVMALLDVEPQSWTSFALLAAFLVLLYAYRYVLRRRRAHG
jgi:4-hydroxybenzoate polyprenyltransferase